MYYYLIAIFVILLDQLTKWLVEHNMYLGESIPIIHNFLYITSHRNRGAAWGILQGQMWLFYVITVVVIIAIMYYLHKAAKGRRLLGTALALMLGGAIGNFIDRIIRKEVVDFIHTYIFGYNFPVFNIADSALVIGVGLLMIQMLLDERDSKEKTYGENGTHRP
ncbi:signal peptidase II [Neobacillus sp. OS1-32]|uniref:Lipoprotein signal peptidase n=1 Tax=Neobacillus paridis TaxID=2803862 RepID=A0ABS1TMP9_9BACI|nr:signal peptidase II [Neobacillus sp. OS1-32]MBL4952610.1 signal peptidase II [Neobacillus paridis]WML31877.1 signal peptidase II [Neobacillus sp. OS1-32]